MTLPLETTPTALTSKICEFCRSIVPNEQPIFVQVQPSEGSQRDECLANVARYAAQFGGSSVLGWCIRERPRVNLRADFYVVWKASNGEFLDVSPKPDGETQILFLHDPKAVLEGKRIPSHFLPLMHWREIQDFLAVNARLKNMYQPGINSIDPNEYASVQAELKRATNALEKRLGRTT